MSAEKKIARLVGSEGMGVLVRQSSTYKSGLGIFLSPKGAKLAIFIRNLNLAGRREQKLQG